MSVEAIPRCTLQVAKGTPVCNRPMFRWGKEGEHGVDWIWVCEECDKRSRENSLDAELA